MIVASRCMSETSRHDPARAVADFIAAMVAAGMRPLDSIAPALVAGGLVRFRCEGDGPGRLNGRAVLHLDGRPAGWFRHMRLGVEATWRADTPAVRLTPGERDAQASEWRAAEAARARAKLAGHLNAARQAQVLWEAAKPASAGHPYLARKRLNPPGLRVHGRTLLVPLRDPAGRLWNVQRIGPDGGKRFMSGARVEGLAWSAGGPATNKSPLLNGGLVLAIGEGMATMAAVHAATGLPVLAALSRSNLAPAARNLRDRYGPAATLLLCADMDVHRPDNPGLAAANAAARVCGGLVAHPPRPPGWPDGDKWDFADTWLAPDGEALIRAALGMRGAR